MWNNLDVQEQSISLNSDYDTWIDGNCPVWIILAIIICNIEYFALL
jgi:hypothetical protein